MNFDFIVFLIKHIFFSICLTYSYIHSLYLNKNTNKLNFLVHAAIGSIGSFIIQALINHLLPSSFQLLNIFACTLLFTLCFQQNFQISLITTIFCTGLTYSFRLPAAALLALLSVTFNLNSNSILYQLFPCITQLTLLMALFHIPRFTHGISFITDSYYSDIGLIISLIILFTIALIQIGLSSNPFYLSVSFSIIIYAFLAVFWIKKSIKRKYLDSQVKKEIQALKDEIEKLKSENQKLKDENQQLSSIIHKDNKLMNAMLLSVKQIGYQVAEETDVQKRKVLSEQIIRQLEETAGDRAAAVSSFEHSGHLLPSTGCSRIDALLSYMDQKAFSRHIAFEFHLGPDFMKRIRAVSTEDLETLLADLLENAIIAVNTKKQEKQNILLFLDFLNGSPAVAVYDSGVPFPEEVRAAWGVCRLTTHADTGGSGIGMMSTYAFCRKYRAHFAVTDCDPGMPYTKCISVCFPELSAV